jgi:hypothetical protein
MCKASRPMHTLPTAVPQFLGWQKPTLWILSALGLATNLQIVALWRTWSLLYLKNREKFHITMHLWHAVSREPWIWSCEAYNESPYLNILRLLFVWIYYILSLPNCDAPLLRPLLVLLKSLCQDDVHICCFTIFRPMEQKLLSLEWFFVFEN